MLGFSLLAASLLAITLAFLRVDPFSDAVDVRAVFDDARGLAKAGTETTTEVRLAGARVGRVSNVERAGDDAVLTLSIEDDEAADALRGDASAELRPRTPFEGNSYVDLAPGSTSAGPLRGEIPKSRTENYVSLYEAFSFARPPIREATRQALRDMSDVLAGEGRRGLQRAFAELPGLTRDLAPGARALGGSHGSELAGVVKGAATSFAAVSAQERNIVPFLRGTERSFSALNTDAGVPLDATLRALPDALLSLESGGNSLRGILDRLDPLARELRPGLRALSPTLDSLEPFLDEAEPALRRTLPLVRNLRAALDAGRRATPATRGLLTDLRPTVDLLNRSLLPALHETTPSGLRAYLSLINTLEGAGGAFSTFQTEEQGRAPGQMGSGHFVHFEGRFYTGYVTPDLPRCELIAGISPEVAELLETQGVCIP